MRRFLAVLTCILISGAAIRKAAAQGPGPEELQLRKQLQGMTAAMHSGSFLGVNVEDVTEESAKTLKLKEERGASIKHVEEGSPAAKAGLKVGDVVLEFNGNRIEGIEQFVRLVGETPAGRKVQIGISREGSAQTVTAVLAGRPKNFGGAFDGHALRMPEMPNMPEMPVTPEMPEMPNMSRDMRIQVLRRGAIGIETEALNGQLAEFFGVKEGVLVRSVNANSPAEKSGMHAGDVITKIDNEAITSARDIGAHTRGSGDGKKSLAVTLVRNKHEMTLTVQPVN